jgi:hypothetical protein
MNTPPPQPPEEPVFAQLPPGIHFGISREMYEAQDAINQSTLKAFAKAKTPAHFKYEKDNTEEDPDKAFLRIGSALDCVIWNPAEFRNKFNVWDGERRQGAEWKAFETSSKACNKIILNVAERDQVLGMLRGLEEHKDIPGILDNCERHVVLIAIHPRLGVRMKAELDLWPKTHSDAFGKWYFELKSTGVGADVPSFQDQCLKLGYLKQVAFYLMMGRLCGFDLLHSCGFLAVESDAPYKAKMHYSSWEDEEIQMELKWIGEWIPRYMECKLADKWPGYSSSWSHVRYPYWALKERQEKVAEELL